MNKQKNSLSGQIFPILLVCIAGLLACIAITKRIGESNVAKTCASNAADAGALAAASYAAGAFNQLALRNIDKYPPLKAGNTIAYMTKDNTSTYYKEMKDYFDEMRPKYETLYNASLPYPDQATKFCSDAKGYIKQARDLMVPEGICKIWGQELTARDLNIQAATALYEASKQLGAFSVYLYYMHELTDHFRRVQMENFSDADQFMQGSQETKDATGAVVPDSAQKGEGGALGQSMQTGQSYGFNNGMCLLPPDPGLGDALGFQQATGSIFPKAGSGGSAATFTYADGACSLSVDVKMPKIQAYQLKRTTWNFPEKHAFQAVPLDSIFLSIPSATFWDDPFNREAAALYSSYASVPESMTGSGDEFIGLSYALHLVADTLTIIATGKGPADSPYLDPTGALFLSNQSIYNATKDVYDQCCKDGKFTCSNPEIYDDISKELGKLKTDEQGILEWLEKILGQRYATIANPVTIPTLKAWNDKIWQNVWTVSGTESFNNYKEVSEYKGVNEDHPGLMISHIDSVTLSSWEVKCTVTSKCGSAETSSNSTATFDQAGIGGAAIGAGNDSYYPEITGSG